MTRAYPIVVAMVAALALPAAASGVTYCVPGPCTGGTAEPDLPTAIQAAIDTAGRDRIELGAGTFTSPSAAFTTTQLDIVGAGQNATRVVAGPNQNAALGASFASTVSDVTLKLGPDSQYGLTLEGGAKASRVTVEPASSADASGTTGVDVRAGGTLADSRVAFPPTGTGAAVRGTASGSGNVSTIDNVSASGSNGLVASPGASASVVARRLLLSSESLPVTVGGDGVTRLSSSLVLLTTDGTAVTVNGLASSPALEARHLTLAGDGSNNSRGLSVLTGANRTASVRLDDSIITDTAQSLERSGPANSTNNLTVTYSNFDSATALPGAPGGTYTAGATNTNVFPGFRDSGDYRLAATSPLIDGGDPAGPGIFDSTADLLGAPRVADGNGDGVARSDKGAFEYQPPASTPPVVIDPPVIVAPPPVTKDTVAPAISGVRLRSSTFRVGSKPTAVSAAKTKKAPRGTTLEYTLSEAATVKVAVERRASGARIESKGMTVCARRTRARRKKPRCTRYAGVTTLTRKGKAGSNTLVFTGRVGSRKLAAGRYRFSLVATDAAGNRSRPRTVAFRVVR